MRWVRWSSGALEYQTRSGTAGREVVCGDTGEANTVTFILKGAVFPERGYHGADLRIRAIEGDAVIRFVRVVKLDRNAVETAGPRG